ncbi:unnamed protein product [Cyclocybe aegerita]|uniref:Uncharacterized protein n=1 Tax=Cyclocybe aegerita TaxID=1973307 RepID=A0A8S0WJR8_CYCAE|nr:unnamed protein product [Cyclocybe aegerita]
MESRVNIVGGSLESKIEQLSFERQIPVVNAVSKDLVHIPSSIPNIRPRRNMSATPDSTPTALISAAKEPIGTVIPPTLERPVVSLVQNVQKVMEAAYNVHKVLLDKNMKSSKKVMEHFLQVKHIFRMECESIRQILQSGYRHASDYAASSQRAPNDRSISPKHCYLSAKSVLQDVQDVVQGYEKPLHEFKNQRNDLTEALKSSAQERQPPQGDPDISASTPFVNLSSRAQDPVGAFYNSLEDVHSSLQDILGFWDHHVSYLVLLVNRQTNFPTPGEETKAVVKLWVSYQAALLQASSSISESADAMSVDPVVAEGPFQKHTFPPSNLGQRDQRLAPSVHEHPHAMNPGRKPAGTHAETTKLFRSWMKGFFHFFSRKAQ